MAASATRKTSTTSSPISRPTNNPTGLVGEAIARGEAEIGIQQIPELMSVPGVDVVGPLPGDLQVITTFSVGLDAKAKEVEAAKALIKFLSAPAAGKVYKSKGLDPA